MLEWVAYFYICTRLLIILLFPGSSRGSDLMNKKFVSPDSTGRSPCRRRSCTATSMTPTTKRSTVVALTSGYILTAWPCRTPQPRWRCFSSSAAACRGWPCPPPSTVITWSRPRPEGRRIWPEQRWGILFVYSNYANLWKVMSLTCFDIFVLILGNQRGGLQLPVQRWGKIWSWLLETRLWNHPSGIIT